MRSNNMWCGREGEKWSKLPQFRKGGPVGSSRRKKLVTKIGVKFYMLNPTFGVYFLVLARCAAGNHFWGKCSANVDIKRGVFQARIFSERSI